MWQIKQSHEIEKIQEACRITDIIFGKLRKYLTYVTSTPQPVRGRLSKWQKEWWQITEKQLELWLLDQIQQAWCKPSFDPIIAAGANAAHPHWKADDTVLHGFVVIDFGVVYQGYMSDMTRTIYVSNRTKNTERPTGYRAQSVDNHMPTIEEIDLYKLVLKAQEDSMRYIKPGKHYKDTHRIAAATLEEYKKYFIHSLGHGIGTIIHEHPRISPKGRWYFKKNMCVTVEPGVYIENKLWIRIEDTCVVTETWCIQLTKSTKKLVVI